MFNSPKFRAVTFRADAILIWGSLASGGLTTLASLIEGRGVALSILIGVAVIPLVFLSIVVVRHHRVIAQAVTRLLTSAGAEAGIDQQGYMYDAAEEAPDINAYYDLMAFALDYLLPACDFQVNLQKVIIKRLSNNDRITQLAIDGLRFANRAGAQNFWTDYDRIVRGIDSSDPTIKFSALIECIRGLERNGYRTVCAHADEIAKQGGLDFKRDPEVGPAWELWRERHNALVQEYDKVRRDVRFGKLFYPLRPGRWGEPVPALTSEPISTGPQPPQ